MSIFELTFDREAHQVTLVAPVALYKFRPTRVPGGLPLHWRHDTELAFADYRTRFTERLLYFFGGIDGLRVNCSGDGRLDFLEFVIDGAHEPESSFNRLVDIYRQPRHIPFVITTYENLLDLLRREGHPDATIEVKSTSH